MTENHKAKLEQLAGDDMMVDAIKGLFNKVIESVKPGIDVGENNTKIGERYRAYIQAQNIVKYTFSDLEAYKEGYIAPSKKNKGK